MRKITSKIIIYLNCILTQNYKIEWQIQDFIIVNQKSLKVLRITTCILLFSFSKLYDLYCILKDSKFLFFLERVEKSFLTSKGKCTEICLQTIIFSIKWMQTITQQVSRFYTLEGYLTNHIVSIQLDFESSEIKPFIQINLSFLHHCSHSYRRLPQTLARFINFFSTL